MQRMSRNTEYSCVIQIHTAHTMAEQAAETHRSWADKQQATERAPRGPSCCLPCLCLSLIRQSRQRMYTVQHVTHRGGYILIDHLSVSYPAVMTLVLTFHLTLVYPVRCWVFRVSSHSTRRIDCCHWRRSAGLQNRIQATVDGEYQQSPPDVLELSTVILHQQPRCIDILLPNRCSVSKLPPRTLPTLPHRRRG